MGSARRGPGQGSLTLPRAGKGGRDRYIFKEVVEKGFGSFIGIFHGAEEAVTVQAEGIA